MNVFPPDLRTKPHRHPPAEGRSSLVIGHSSFSPGFTLLEVVCALAIIIFLIGGVYGIAEASTRLGATMGRTRITETRVTNLLNHWRDHLETLPRGAMLTADATTLQLTGGGAPFAWRRELLGCDATRLVLQGDTLQVSHLRSDGAQGFTAEAEMPLLSGLRECRWEFFDSTNKSWAAVWAEDRASLPMLMRWRFAFAAEPAVHEHTFWLSGVAAAPGTETSAPTPPANP